MEKGDDDWIELNDLVGGNSNGTTFGKSSLTMIRSLFSGRDSGLYMMMQTLSERAGYKNQSIVCGLRRICQCCHCTLPNSTKSCHAMITRLQKQESRNTRTERQRGDQSDMQAARLLSILVMHHWNTSPKYQIHRIRLDVHWSPRRGSITCPCCHPPWSLPPQR